MVEFFYFMVELWWLLVIWLFYDGIMVEFFNKRYRVVIIQLIYFFILLYNRSE